MTQHAADSTQHWRIVIPDDDPPLYQGSPELAELQRLGEVTLYERRATSPTELRARLADADVAINVRAYTRFDRATLLAAPRLRLIAVVGTGTDNIDLPAATELGVAVCNCPGANARSVAEFTIALILAAARHIPLMDRQMRAGLWQHIEGVELRGKTLGVIGLGAIGQEVAQMGVGLGMQVVAWSLHHDPLRASRVGARLVEWEELFRTADVVSLHLRASPQTVGIIGARELGWLKRGAIFVNTARGALVDEEALRAAVQDGRIRAAGLDVFAEEPLRADSPWRTMDNVVLTPHVAWVTQEATTRLRLLPIENIAAFLAGAPRNVVNPEALRGPRQRASG